MRKLVSEVFSRLVDGLFAGIGFAIVAVFVFQIEKGSRDENSELEKLNDLTIVWSDDIKGKNGCLAFNGQVKNNSESRWSSIELEVELFVNDTFVFECRDYIFTDILPNSEEFFTMECIKCEEFWDNKNNYPINYDTYHIKIVGGH